MVHTEIILCTFIFGLFGDLEQREKRCVHASMYMDYFGDSLKQSFLSPVFASLVRKAIRERGHFLVPPENF